MWDTSVHTWQCSCVGDPVGDSAGPVLADILRRAPEPEQRKSLRDSQVTLIRRLCRDDPALLGKMYWVQTYVEPEDRIARALRGTGDGERALNVLHSAADISADPGVAEAFYSEKLIPLLKAVEIERIQQVSLSYRFTQRDTPPVVRLWREPGGIVCDWSSLQIDSLYHALFDDGRENGEYLHIAYPYRVTDLSKYVGPAGAYLFVTERNALSAFPACFALHIQMFVQALVTAQLWAIAQHLQEDLRNRQDQLHTKTKVLRRNSGVLRKIANAADELVAMADPLGIETGAFDEAQRAAERMFGLKPTMEQTTALLEKGVAPSSALHTVNDWKRLPEDAKKELTKLASNLEDIAARSQATVHLTEEDSSGGLVKAIAQAIRQALMTGNDTGLDQALRHAKALEHHSVIVKLLVKDSASTATIRELAQGGRDQAKRYLRQAVLRLWRNRSMLRHPDVNRLVIHYSRDASSVYGLAIEILDNREWATGEGNLSQDLAGILRGLRGGGDLTDLAPEAAEAVREGASGSEDRTVWMKFDEHPED